MFAIDPPMSSDAGWSYRTTLCRKEVGGIRWYREKMKKTADKRVRRKTKEGFVTKKSLGQHFLRSEGALREIAEALGAGPLDVVVEIGPGEGVLTQKILQKAGKVLAIEKDARLIPLLSERFAPEIALGRLEVVEADALTFEPKILGKWLKDGFTYKVVGNIPYYITGALLRKFLEGALQPTTLVFLMQKEVAKRIVAAQKPKKESLLSLSVKAFGTPRYIKTVPKGAFVPAPSVDSAILLIENISRDRFTDSFHEARFFKLIHAGFAQKRKLLARNLEDVISKARIEEAFEALAIAKNTRAEDLPFEKWLQLATF